MREERVNGQAVGRVIAIFRDHIEKRGFPVFRAMLRSLRVAASRDIAPIESDRTRADHRPGDIDAFVRKQEAIMRRPHPKGDIAIHFVNHRWLARRQSQPGAQQAQSHQAKQQPMKRQRSFKRARNEVIKRQRGRTDKRDKAQKVEKQIGQVMNIQPETAIDPVLRPNLE